MSALESVDAVVIGTGQAGKPLAVALGKAGWRVAVVERDAVGGTCINVGCTPTKTVVASARVAHLARRAAEYGVRCGEVSVDLARVRDRKRRVVEGFRRAAEGALERAQGVELLRGHGRFTAPREVEVELVAGGRRRLRAERVVVLDTGTRASVPPIPGLDGVPFLDNASVMELAELPSRLLVLGGGYIGVELGQAFRRFGAEVTIVQRGPQLLPREDADVARAVAEILEQDGVEVILGAEARSVSGVAGDLRLELATAGGPRVLAGSHLLVAAGRTPNSDDLGLPAAGVETDARGHVRVDSRLRTSADGVFATGDVNGGPAFTHVAYDDYRVLRTNLLQGGDATTEGRLVPYTLYLDPQLGRVGVSEEEARRGDRPFRVAKLPMTRVARALETGETRGFMKAIVDTESAQILGCAVLGIEGGEVMSVLQTAMMGRVPYTTLKEAIYAHPTLAESLNNLFLTLDP